MLQLSRSIAVGCLALIAPLQPAVAQTALPQAALPQAIVPQPGTLRVAAAVPPRLEFSEAEMALARAVADSPVLAAFYGSNGLRPVDRKSVV